MPPPTEGAPAPARRSPGRGPWAAALLPAQAALLLGLWGIRREGTIWRDESVTYQVAHRSLPEIRHLLGNADAVHGLYYVLMHALFAAWDGGLVALRLPSVLATASAAALTGLIGHRLAGARAGVLSGLAFAAIPLVQIYAQEGRSYALVCALIALATYLLARAVTRPSRGMWITYAGTVLVAAWLHEFALLALLAHGVTVAVSQLPRGIRRAWGVSALAAAAGVAPPAFLSAGQTAQVAWIGGPSRVEWLRIGAVALLGLACARCRARRRGRLTPACLAHPHLLVPTGVLLLTTLHKSLYVDRYVLYSSVGLGLLVGTALDQLLLVAGRRTVGGRRWPAPMAVRLGVAAVLAALVPVTLQMRTPDSRKDDVTAIAHAVRDMSAGADGVLFIPARRREWALSYPRAYRGLADLALQRGPLASDSLQGEERAAARIRERILSARRIIALSDPVGQPRDATTQEAVKRRTLWAHFEECTHTTLKGARITLYARPGTCPSPPRGEWAGRNPGAKRRGGRPAASAA